MTPQRAFLKKEVWEFLRTWRIWVLTVPILIFAIGGPIFTYFSPVIFETTFDAYSDGSIDVFVPKPTWIDSYMQWATNLKRVVPVIVLVIAGSAITGEVVSGSAIPVLTGGLGRKDFVLIKFAIISTMAVAAIVVGTMINWIVGKLLFPDMRFVGVIAIIGVASLLVLVLVALAILASTFMPDAMSTIGLEMFIFLILSVATLWSPARQFSPAGLLSSLTDLARNGEANFIAPALSTIIFTIVLLTMAVTIFQRREL